MLHIRVLGHTEVQGPQGLLGLRDFGGVKTRRILEILVLHRGRSISKDQLAELLWDGRPPRNHVATIESYVSMLRARLERGVARRDSAIVTGTGCYSIDVAKVTIDVDEFDRLMVESALQDPETALRTLTAARRLARGPLLAHEPYAAWAEAARRQFHDRLVAATVESARLALEVGRVEVAISLADTALDLDAYSETAAQLAMHALWNAGRRVEALKRYEDLRRRLRDDLAMEPNETLQALFLALLRADETATAASHPELTILIDAVVELYRRAKTVSAEAADSQTPMDPSPRQPPPGGTRAVTPERLLIDLVAQVTQVEGDLAVA